MKRQMPNGKYKWLGRGAARLRGAAVGMTPPHSNSSEPFVNYGRKATVAAPSNIGIVPQADEDTADRVSRAVTG